MPGIAALPALIVSSMATTVWAANLLYIGTYAMIYAAARGGLSMIEVGHERE